eukprot:c19417_g1_i1 orf=68-1531(+)
MPGLYAQLRSSSSSSSTTSAAKPPFPSHHRHGTSHAPSTPTPVPTASHALPAFRTTTNPLLVIPVASAQPILPKQFTDPSTYVTRTRLYGTSALNYSSSGSPHDPSTACLAAMVHEFLEEEVSVGSCGRTRCNCIDGVCGGEEACIPDEPEEPQLPDEQLCEILEGITSCTSKPELLVLVDVARAVEVEMEEFMGAGDDGKDGGAIIDCLRRPVMKRLRQEGYNAAICKSRWKHTDGLPAGDYEYIDVLVDGNSGSKKQERFIVDIDFKAQFEIARASRQYAQLLDVLPRLYVGRAERLKQILKIMSNAAKRSLKEQGLLLPPWRKHKYMQAKWFSSYRRTTNTESLSPSLQSPDHLLGLGLRAPKILSLDFTKEMDLLFYTAQARGLNNMHQHNQHLAKRNLLPVNAPSDMGLNRGMRTGFANNPSENSSTWHDVCTTVCTDWQLPALDERCKDRDRVSGISTAFKQASLLPKQPSSRLSMVSVVS